MGTRLFIGNLPFDATEDQIKDIFAKAGHAPDSVKIVTDRETGRSRGFAFVDVATEETAKAAINDLNGKDFGGRPLRVNEAEEKGAGGGNKFGGGGFRGGPPHGMDRDQQRGGFGSRGPGQDVKRGSQRGGGRGGSRGS